MIPVAHRRQSLCPRKAKMPKPPQKRLKRLDPSFYSGPAYVHWTMTVQDRHTGWLTERFHPTFRQDIMHVCARYFLCAPVYCMMPDHLHLLWIGLDARADQLAGIAQLRRYLNQSLQPEQLQDQAYDHVLREADRQADAFPDVVGYILRNPVRAELVEDWTEWPYSGACFPGYPTMDPRKSYFWDNLPEVFDFGRDYLGLLKAALVASGLIPPGLEGCGAPLRDVLEKLVGPGRGFELISCVHNIPKGSRLAVSTNLMAACIAACMRATGQIHQLDQGLEPQERSMLAARSILGEWLGGSGGGWQDSGGVWPGIKWITGVAAEPGDSEYGVSRGRLVPRHKIFDLGVIPESARRKLQESLILVHGGLAQNVGPILEMVMERYLLRESASWAARQEALRIADCGNHADDS